MSGPKSSKGVPSTKGLVRLPPMTEMIKSKIPIEMKIAFLRASPVKETAILKYNMKNPKKQIPRPNKQIKNETDIKIWNIYKSRGCGTLKRPKITQSAPIMIELNIKYFVIGYDSHFKYFSTGYKINVNELINKAAITKICEVIISPENIINSKLTSKTSLHPIIASLYTSTISIMYIN